MKTFGDLLVAGKKLLPLYTAEWNPFHLFWLLAAQQLGWVEDFNLHTQYRYCSRFH